MADSETHDSLLDFQPSLDIQEGTRVLRRKYLINKLNHINFTESSIECEFIHQDSNAILEIPVIPGICIDNRCDFRWEDPSSLPGRLHEYAIRCLRFSEDSQQVFVIPEEYSVGAQGVSVLLPKTAEIRRGEEGAREAAAAIKGIILQSGIAVEGVLRNFSVGEMELETEQIEKARWIDPTRASTLLLMRGDDPIYSETVSIELQFNQQGRRYFKISVPSDFVSRYPARQYRSHRSELKMNPLCRFIHPLSGRPVERRLLDLSGSGFALSDVSGTANLPVGLIIDDLHLNFAEFSAISLRAQVIQRRAIDNSAQIHYGLCILDIEPQDHLILLSIIHQTYNPHTSLCKQIDMKQLWRFFFDSGFIYPEKYNSLQDRKEEIRRSFERLYNHRNDVARHFVYQKEDRILGHLSMVRFYERTWLLHHHASASQSSENAGIHVLNQIGSYVNDSCRFSRMNLDYLMCFFRPTNSFPMKLFGGLVDYANNRKICSSDEVAYCRIPNDESLDGELFWSLATPTMEDYRQLSHFYEEISGGLLLDAMNIPPYGADEEANAGVCTAFHELGIKREFMVRALHHNGRLAAVFIINRSDPGVNLSDFPNAITAFLIKPDILNRDLLLRAAAEARGENAGSYTPLLVFPRESADKLNVVYEKSYNTWIMDTRIGDTYFEHIQSILRTVQS